MNKKYWTLVLNNFEGEDSVVYFENYEIAKENFKAICKTHKNFREFSKTEDSCEWFNSRFNECSTFVYLREKRLPKIYNEIIFS